MATDKVVTGVVRVDFPKLFKSQLTDKDKTQKGEDRYSITLILEPDSPDISKLKAIVEQAKKEKWGDKAPFLKPAIRKGVPKSEEYAYGYDLEKYPAYEGKLIITAGSVKHPPGVVDADLNQIIDPNEIYSGCYCRVSLVAFGYDNESKGVAFGLQNVQKVKDGERISGTRPKAEDDFEPIKPVATGNHLDMLEV